MLCFAALSVRRLNEAGGACCLCAGQGVWRRTVCPESAGFRWTVLEQLSLADSCRVTVEGDSQGPASEHCLWNKFDTRNMLSAAMLEQYLRERV